MLCARYNVRLWTTMDIRLAFDIFSRMEQFRGGTMAICFLACKRRSTFRSAKPPQENTEFVTYHFDCEVSKTGWCGIWLSRVVV